jgi:hypothetical protein
MLTRKALRTVLSRIIACGSGETIVVHAMYFANTTAAARTLRVHHLSQADSATTDNAIFYEVRLTANSTLVDSTRIMLNEGDQLVGVSDAAGVTCTIYGVRSA